MHLGFTQLTTGHLVMYAFVGALLYLALIKRYEPMLLLPMAFGCLLVNIPMSGAGQPDGWLSQLYRVGIATEMFPILIFIGIGAMLDFGPLLSHPSLALLGLAAQAGIFVTVGAAFILGFPLAESVAIGIIGAADGPTSIYVANRLAPSLLAPISVAAYSYMALVPVIQPPLLRLLTTKHERCIRAGRPRVTVTRMHRILFPIAVTFLCGMLIPISTELIGALMFGNLLRESKVVDRLSASAQNELANVVTMFLGITIGSTMRAETMLQPESLIILALGLFAFSFGTGAGILFAKFLNLFLTEKINPMVGAAGISAFPMSARIVHQMGQAEDRHNFLLMQAAGANAAGQIGSIVAGTVLLSLAAVWLGIT